MSKITRKEKKHIPLVIGNWKMNPETVEKAKVLAGDIKKSTSKKNPVAVVGIASPFLYIPTVATVLKKTRFAIASQDVSFEKGGAFTGEISIPMLKNVGVSLCIIGHSERRASGESDEVIHKKVEAVLKSGLTAVVCVGEKVRDAQGDYFSFVESQLISILKNIPKAQLQRLVIAYEPIWAIGTGKHATAEDVQEMKLFIQKVISDTVERSAVAKVRIIYGGSVNKDNADELLQVGKADGFLVGGSSLKAEEFAKIIEISDAYGKA